MATTRSTTYETPTLATYGSVHELTEIVDGTYGGGPPIPPGSSAGDS